MCCCCCYFYFFLPLEGMAGCSCYLSGWSLRVGFNFTQMCEMLNNHTRCFSEMVPFGCPVHPPAFLLASFSFYLKDSVVMIVAQKYFFLHLNVILEFLEFSNAFLKNRVYSLQTQHCILNF